MTRDQQLAERAKAHGARFSLRIIIEARRAGLPVSLGFALVEQESGFANTFGHDPTIFAGAGTVTKAKYLAYKAKRGANGRGGMQGVGPCQLTFYTYQDRADKLGGCWVARHNIHVAFTDLAAMVAKHGESKGLAVYNAGEAGWRNGREYAHSVQQRQAKWHGRLA
jgi:hypothetical protein